jgi:hypothetical protein
MAGVKGRDVQTRIFQNDIRRISVYKPVYPHKIPYTIRIENLKGPGSGLVQGPPQANKSALKPTNSTVLLLLLCDERSVQIVITACNLSSQIASPITLASVTQHITLPNHSEPLLSV